MSVEPKKVGDVIYLTSDFITFMKCLKHPIRCSEHELYSEYKITESDSLIVDKDTLFIKSIFGNTIRVKPMDIQSEPVIKVETIDRHSKIWIPYMEWLEMDETLPQLVPFLIDGSTTYIITNVPESLKDYFESLGLKYTLEP